MGIVKEDNTIGGKEMPQLKEILTGEEFSQAWNNSTNKAVLLFKQSTTCPISAGAFMRFNTFLKSTTEDIEAYFVKVRETREVSNQIAEETGVQHQSPQILLVKNKEVLWNASHAKITEESIEAALKEV